MNEQIADAKKRLGEALADAQKDLNKALLEAQIAYQKAIDKIQKDTEKKLADLKAKLAEVAKAMAALGAQQASLAAMAKAPTYTLVGGGSASTGTPFGQAGGTTVNNNTTVNAFTEASPYAIAFAVTNAAKFSAPVTTNTTTLAGIMAASAVKPTSKSSTPFYLQSGMRAR
jgi:chromosome segregation ATPase